MRITRLPQSLLLHSLLVLLVIALALVTEGSTAAPQQLLPEGKTGASRPDLPDLPPAEPWSGYAFDACRAPSQRAMDAWWRSSPFVGVGVYIGGRLRACPQRQLTRRWVRAQTGRGWHLLPIWVGPQAACTRFHARISSARGAKTRYPVARREGVREAHGALHRARALGLSRGETLWYDLEFFDDTNPRCRSSVLSFLSAWTTSLHGAGYRAGVYSNVSSGIDVLDTAPRRYAVPDRVWFAWANGRPDTSIDREWVRSSAWKQRGRAHQYWLDHVAAYGGVRMAIDSSFVHFGRPGSVVTAAECGPDANRGGYPRLRRESKPRLVQLAQCLLGRGRHDTLSRDRLSKAVRTFQRERRMRPTGVLDRRTWTALLAGHSASVAKRGSVGPRVRRLQRALNAVLPHGPSITGRFGPETTDAVRRYQGRVGIRPTGVVALRTWQALEHGEVGHAHHRHHHAKHAEHPKHGGRRPHGRHGGHHPRHQHPRRHGHDRRH